MGLKCWDGATCTRDCIKPCRPPIQATAPSPCRQSRAHQAETIRDMSPTNQFFDDGDPRRVFSARRVLAPTDNDDPRRAIIERAMSPDTVNFRRLFKLYATLMLRKRGVTYIRTLLTDADLTDAEYAAICQIGAEVKRENPE